MRKRVAQVPRQAPQAGRLILSPRSPRSSSSSETTHSSHPPPALPGATNRVVTAATSVRSGGTMTGTNTVVNTTDTEMAAIGIETTAIETAAGKTKKGATGEAEAARKKRNATGHNSKWGEGGWRTEGEKSCNG
mmetsp:Transcript_67150/g.135337  ORF Transcript_67150/g.135337 Transcript_67150/m.135337 type:complete len:134 (-) Transcript_67150:231-632(-)